jgi:transcriptional regulator with XRE-family HTH domain
MGVNWRTVHRWQSGQLPKYETLARLADVLEVPQSYLVESDDLLTTLADLSSRLDDLARRVDELTRAVEG